MKVEWIITVESETTVPDNDWCDEIADRLEHELVMLVVAGPGVAETSSAWRKTL